METLSKGENTVLFDQNGVPSVMVRLKAVSGAELLEGCEDQTLHEVFRTDGEPLEEIWVGKYLSGRWEGAAAQRIFFSRIETKGKFLMLHINVKTLFLLLLL